MSRSDRTCPIAHQLALGSRGRSREPNLPARMSCIDLDLLPDDPNWRLQPALLAAFCSAAAVVLQRFHTSPHGLAIVTGDALHVETLVWSRPDTRALATHANVLDAVEFGASALAFAALRRFGPYVVLKRAEHGTGADFVLARAGREEEPWTMLEVSGIAQGDGPAVAARLRRKLGQLSAHAYDGPRLAVVVRFQRPQISIAEV